MNQNGSSRHHLAESDDATRAIAASRQWHDVELALKVARHSFERWLVADQLARNLAMVLMTPAQATREQ